MDSAPVVRVLLANAFPVVSEGLLAIFARHAFVNVVGVATNGVEAAALCRALQPDIIVMDNRLMDGVGLKMAAFLFRECPDARIIMFSLSDLAEDIYQAFRAGVKAYVFSDTLPDALFDTMRAVQEGRNLVPPAIAARLAQDAQH